MKNKNTETTKKVDSSVKEEFNNLFKNNEPDVKLPPLTSDSNTSKASTYKFVQKLIEILSNNTLKKIVKWSEDGNNLEILNQREFTDKVLPMYFKHNNYSNFIRQLNMYHFKKVKNFDTKDANTISYSNDFFKKNSTHLIGEIHRKQQYAGCGNSYIDKEEKSVNNDHFTNKLNTLFNKIFDLEEKVKQLNNVNDTIISNNMNFIEDIKDKSYYIGVLENVIFYIVNNFLSTTSSNITINNSYSNFENMNDNIKALAPADSNDNIKTSFENQSKSNNSSMLNNANRLEEMKNSKNDEKFLAILEKESAILECTCGCIKNERKNSNNSIITCNSNFVRSNIRENEIKKNIIIIKEEPTNDIKSCNSMQVNNVNVNYEYQDEGISSLGSRNNIKSNEFFLNFKDDKPEEKELFQNVHEEDPRKKYVDLINKLKKEKSELENEINEKKNKQFCKKCFVNELKCKIKSKILDQGIISDASFEKNFDSNNTENLSFKKASENNSEGAFKHLLNRFKEYSSKKNINTFNNSTFSKKLYQLTKHENNIKDTPSFNFYNDNKLNLKEKSSPPKINSSNNFIKFTKKSVENIQNDQSEGMNNGILINKSLDGILNDNKLGINSNLELSDKFSGRKRSKK